MAALFRGTRTRQQRETSSISGCDVVVGIAAPIERVSSLVSLFTTYCCTLFRIHVRDSSLFQNQRIYSYIHLVCVQFKIFRIIFCYRKMSSEFLFPTYCPSHRSFCKVFELSQSIKMSKNVSNIFDVVNYFLIKCFININSFPINYISKFQ